MKRSNSKKEALSKPEDGTQQKISSFFQPGATQAQSKLFTSVKRSKAPLCLRGRGGAPQPSSAPTTKPASTDSKQRSSCSSAHMIVLKDYNNVVKSLQAAPQHKTPQKSASKPKPAVEGSPDVVIPDTPEDKLVKLRPKPASRSFLCPVGLLSTVPGTKLSPPKSKPKRVVKKSLGLVSVEFGQTLLSGGAEREEGKGRNSLSVDSGNAECLSNATNFVNSNSNASSKTRKMGLISLGEDVDFTDFSFESGFSPPPVKSPQLSSSQEGAVVTTVTDSEHAVTPTKSSADGQSVKRMAQSGLSPDPKRTFSTEAMHADDWDRPLEPTTSQRMVKAKRQLALMGKFKNVKEMNRSVNNYQLGGGTKDKVNNDVTCTEDAVLADILGQMGDIPTQQQKKPDFVYHNEKRSSVLLSTSLQEQKMEAEPFVCSAQDKVLGENLGAVNAQDDEVLGEILGELNNAAGQEHGTGSWKCSEPQTSKRNLHNSFSKAGSLIKKERRASDLGPPAEASTMRNNPWRQENNVKHSTWQPADTESKSAFTADFLAADEHSLDGRSNVEPVHSLKQTGVKSIGIALRADDADSEGGLKVKLTPTKAGEQRLPLPADVAEVLAGSLGKMSPFKSTTPRKPSQAPSQSDSVSSVKFTEKWNRYVVHSVSYDSQSYAKTLKLSKEGNPEVTKKAILRGSWSDTHLESGDIVHFLLDGRAHKASLGDEEDGVIVIDDSQGQVVVNPDLLLSGTAIVSGVYCLRRSVLNEKFKGVDSKNVHMLHGSIIHSLFQEVLKDRLTKTEEILTRAQSIVQSNKFLHEMYGQSATEARVMEEIRAYVGPLQAWLEKHVPSRNQAKTHRCSDVSVVQIHDIEETIWSPRLGIKGKIDMTVEVEMQKERGAVRRKVLPLELKTGKASYSVEHKGQVTLYSLMMSERREDPEEGLLLYLKQNDMSAVPVKSENTRGLLQLRNEMAYYLSRQTQKETEAGGHVTYHLGRLPSPINSLRSCSKCPQLINCAVYQRSVEDLRHSTDHAMSGLVPDTLSHLSESHLSYFTFWLLCMDLETSSQHREGLRNIWCMSSSERERRGDCLQQLVIVDSVLGVPETQAFTEGKGCCVQFQRRPGFSGGALNEVGLGKNDSVVVSSEDGRYIALSTGFIKQLTESVVEVVVDRDSFHENASFQSLVFRIDRCDAFNTAGYLLTNLSRLMDPSPHCHKLRSLIIDGRKPEFQMKMSKTAVEKVKKIFKPLNKAQKTAILKVLMSKDFVLVKGYPGTGKTSTIVALVKILRELGQSVLLTSYTHSAVDNILIKLKADGVPFLRLGRSSRIHPLIQDHAAETLTLDISSVDELTDFYSSYGIVATSCLGINHPVFTRRRFDVCIVDEASQVLQPACLGPLFNADRFVLVGDPQQLPPVVRSKEASGLGMGQSLFTHLDGAGATYDLNLQYRMNSTIMQLSNELVYQGALQCGDDRISVACIQPADMSVGRRSEWLGRALDTSLTNAVVFLDTCQISATESCDGRGVTNEVEADLILCLCTTFVQAGISATDIGVIAPYRAQVRALQQRLSECFPLKGVEVNTVDQYQGRDKSVIFISFVRSTPSSEPVSRGGLLQDVRRLNVAVTRAKHKLVFVGDSSSLSHYQPVSTLLSNLRSRQQIFILPTDFQLQSNVDG